MQTFKEFLLESEYMSYDFSKDEDGIKKDIESTIKKELGPFLKDSDIKLKIEDGRHRTDLIRVYLIKGRKQAQFSFYASLETAGMSSNKVKKIAVDPDVGLDMKYKHRSISSKKDGSDLGKKFSRYIKRKFSDIEEYLSK